MTNLLHVVHQNLVAFLTKLHSEAQAAVVVHGSDPGEASELASLLWLHFGVLLSMDPVAELVSVQVGVPGW